MLAKHNCIQKNEEEVAFHRDELAAQALYQVHISFINKI